VRWNHRELSDEQVQALRRETPLEKKDQKVEGDQEVRHIGSAEAGRVVANRKHASGRSRLLDALAAVCSQRIQPVH